MFLVFRELGFLASLLPLWVACWHQDANILPQLSNIPNSPKQSTAMLKKHPSKPQPQPNKPQATTQTQKTTKTQQPELVVYSKVLLQQPKKETFYFN
jgi:hypothetical protein